MRYKIYICLATIILCAVFDLYSQNQDSIRNELFKSRILDTIGTTLRMRTYKYFRFVDMNDKEQIRDSINRKPCFIYYFSSNCSVCLLEIPMINDLYKEYIGKIDFLSFTPILKNSFPQHYSESKIPKFPIISVHDSYFRSGFPVAYILDKKNRVMIRKNGGSTVEEIRKIEYQVLKEWCEKVISNDDVKTEL
jgi:thiol-disulfide isomerase/thioredoxin